MPAVIAPDVFGIYHAEAIRAFTEHGPQAFESPRSAALAHEASHCIVATHDGRRIKRVAIWDHRGYPRVWGGETLQHSRRGLQFDAGTPRAKMIVQICFMLAGMIGEAVFDPSGVREASSPDEAVVSQLLAKQSEGDDQAAERLWRMCCRRTTAILGHNEKPARELIAALDRTETIRGAPLAKLLAGVRRLPVDVPGMGAELRR